MNANDANGESSPRNASGEERRDRACATAPFHARRRRNAIASAFALLLVSTWARAQTSADAAIAQGLFDDARQLMGRGNYAEACPKLEESEKLDPGSGTLINLGECYDRVGRTASAWTTFIEAATSARAAGKLERERTARARAAALAPRVPKMLVQAPASARIRNLEIRRDDVIIGRPQWGTALPIDPGSHTVSASANGQVLWSTRLTVARDGSTVTVVVPELEIPSKPATTPNATPSVEAPSQRPRVVDQGSAAPSKGGIGTAKTLALAATGLGLAGVVIGTVYGLESKSKHDEAHGSCASKLCSDQSAVAAAGDAIIDGNIATVAFVAGGVALATGAVLWLTAGPSSTEVSVGMGSILVRRSW